MLTLSAVMRVTVSVAMVFSPGARGGLTVLIRGCWFKPGKIIREILRVEGLYIDPWGGGVGQNKYTAGLSSSNNKQHTLANVRFWTGRVLNTAITCGFM